MCKYVFLQLSDLHFGKDNQTSSEMRENLKIDVIKHAVRHRFFYDGLIISGDIIFGKVANKKEAYCSASDYIRDIQNKLCIPKTHTYIVPGNHDIDIANPKRNEAIEKLRETYKVRDGRISPQIADELKPTDLFAEMYRCVTGKPYKQGHQLFTMNRDIDVLCIDSSRSCITSKNDYGKIILGMNDIAKSLSGNKKNRRLIAIAHHRYDWLHEGEKNKLISNLSKRNALLFCCGHVHSAEAYIERSIHNAVSDIIVSVAPTLMDDASEEAIMGYNIIQVDTDNGSVYIESYEWRDKNTRFALNWQFPEGQQYKENEGNPLDSYIGLRVNSCELCLSRHARNLSISDLAEATNIDKKTLENYERLNGEYTLENMLIYPECKRSIDILRLSYALHISWKKLVASPDYWKEEADRIEKYMLKKQVKTTNIPVRRGKTKVVVFDFDGTMTKNATLRTSWERMWVSCGYPVENCRELHKAYALGQFSHQEWCDKTAAAFMKKDFSRSNIHKIASEIELLDDCKEVIELLHSQGIQLFIVSGSVDVLIKEVLGDNTACMFSKIQANQMQFCQDGKLDRIIGTKYDFAGKAKYVKGIIAKGYKPSEIVFFGNSFNDESVCSTGVRSVCINPKQARSYEPSYWTDEIANVTSMKTFLKYIEE